MSIWNRIESTLRQHPGVKNCVVIQCKDARGNQCFVAYVVANPAVGTTANELHNHISATLPNYEVPGVIVFRPILPLRADGKIDRARLRAMDLPERNLPQPYVAPRTLNETLMAKIWQETLNIKDIGVHDNFFDIVRDSFVAMEIIARVRKGFAVKVPVCSLFADPTVAGMTAAVMQQKVDCSNDRGIAESPRDLKIPRPPSDRLHLHKT